jgi:hypothetical protein
MYEWKPKKFDTEAFRAWHVRWVAEYRKKHGKEPTQMRMIRNAIG